MAKFVLVTPSGKHNSSRQCLISTLSVSLLPSCRCGHCPSQPLHSPWTGMTRASTALITFLAVCLFVPSSSSARIVSPPSFHPPSDASQHDTQLGVHVHADLASGCAFPQHQHVMSVWQWHSVSSSNLFFLVSLFRDSVTQLKAAVVIQATDPIW